MTKERIGLGLIGTGNVGRIHLTGISSLIEAGLVNVQISALCDSDPKSLKEAAELFGVETVYEDYEGLINDEGVNIVYVCTPTSKHGDMVKATAKAGKHVFCEKPLAHSTPQARELLMVTKDAGVMAGVGLVLRLDQLLLYAKNLLAKHDFGKPILAHIRDDQRFPVDYIYYSKWRGDRSIAGGGTLIEHSIHDIDILQWFLGDVESVYAKIGFFAGREVEDQASLIMTHKDGAVSTLDSIWHWVERPNERRIEFFFEKGYMGIALESEKRFLDYQLQGQSPVRVSEIETRSTLLNHLGLVEKKLSPDVVEVLTEVGSERYAALSYSFLKAILSGNAPSPDFMDAIAAHKVVDAAYRSSSESRCVEQL
ncbi:MAG: Gfo/Idh/MocA family oxidoreductase [Candidatus Thorarchaeota archaeon]|nr:MAG: Gfo/Idh/MocA family oxidoreductase [Candidatus Thorarchaeota archaeon]